MTQPLVLIEGLDLSFSTLDGDSQVLKGISLHINPGEIVGLVGETGSGKSVTAKYLLGILPQPPARVTNGKAMLFGHDLRTIAPAQREALKSRIAYVPQDPMAALNPSFKVGTQMIDAIIWDRCGRSLARYLIQRRLPSVRQQALDHAAHLLDKVHITDPRSVLERYPVQLSGGMRQRVLLAMAISGSPQLLIADEPTTALDVTVQKAIVEIIQELVQERNLAGLYITHDLGVARWLCARTYVMYRGVIVDEGETTSLLDTPQHPYTRNLVDSIPRLYSSGQEAAPQADIDAPYLRVKQIDRMFQVKDKVVHAVKSVSFDVAAGETFAIVGESGSGKSTLAQILARILAPSSGTVEYNGKDITNLQGKALRALRKNIQMVFQDPGSSLNPRRTVEDIIGLPLALHGMSDRQQRRERITELLEAVHLPADTMKRRPSSLSGGQKQRVSIARALALQPDILILDEPTSALDVSVQARILNLLRELKQTHQLTYIIITHDLGVVREIADRIAVMYLGDIVEIGTTDAILRHPSQEYTQRLISAVPLVHASDRQALIEQQTAA